MGRGNTVRRQEYLLFADLISSLVRRYRGSGWIPDKHALYWRVAGLDSARCSGQPAQRASLDAPSREPRPEPLRRGPAGVDARPAASRNAGSLGTVA